MIILWTLVVATALVTFLILVQCRQTELPVNTQLLVDLWKSVEQSDRKTVEKIHVVMRQESTGIN